jgi:hypothetical protein
MDKIYVVRGTERVGPFSQAEIQAQLASGALTARSRVWWEGLKEWTPISRTPLTPASAAAPPAPASMPQAPAAAAPAPAPAAVAPITTPGFAPAPIPALQAGVPVTAPIIPAMSVLALISLITGIIGLPASFCWLLGGPLDLTAVVTGHIAYYQIKRDPTQSGSGMALAGLICGYLGMVLMVGIVFLSVLIALGQQVKQQGMH